MAKQDKSAKPGFVIKLSNETVQKLTEEEQQHKNKCVLKPLENVVQKEEKLKHTEISSTETLRIIASETSKDTNDSIIEKAAAESTDQKPDNISGNYTENVSDSNTNSVNTSWGDYAPYITYEGEEAIYTDPTTQQKYTWNKDSSSWDLKSEQRVYSYEDDTHIYTESDGSKFFWDENKKAWIPKVDDDFLAYYQMSYGFIDNISKDQGDKKTEKEKELQKKDAEKTGVKRKNEPQWFQPSDDTNTKVYVSNLPQDLTEEEFVNFMQKCGLVERELTTHKMKVKLYMDKEHDCFKGDALCTYIKIESVDLALKLLDGMDFKGNKIKVERAHFQLKGEYNPALKPKKKKKKELEKIKKIQQKLFDWRPEKFIGERSKHERVVIIKNLFQPSDFDKEVQLILDYQQDLREECAKCGEVRKVFLYDRHPEGVAQVTMKEPEQADAVVQLINGRWFGKRQLTAEIWDGRTKYRIAETDAQINKRIEKWDKFLEGKEEEDKNKQENSSTDPTKVVEKTEVLETAPENIEIKSDEEPTTQVSGENIGENKIII